PGPPRGRGHAPPPLRERARRRPGRRPGARVGGLGRPRLRPGRHLPRGEGIVMTQRSEKGRAEHGPGQDAATNAKTKGPNPEPQPGQGPALATTCLADIRPQPVHWLVPGYLPRGKLVLLAGDGGHGKSTLTLDLAANLTTGRPCLGLEYDPLPPCDVLLIS